MYNTSFIKKILLVATVVVLYSCDKDFNAIGDGLIADDHFGLVSEKYDVLAYNQEVTPVQSNGLTLYGLGIYDSSVFGTNTSNFVTQVALSTDAPTIGDITGVDNVIQSVVLSVPYLSHATAADAKGGNVYALDSIYGDPKGKIKLSVYESGVQMRSSFFNGGSEFAQLYYTNQDSPDSNDINFNLSKIGTRLNDDADKAQNDEFFFSAAQRKDSTLVEGSTDKYTYTYIAPEMHLNLNKDYFLNKILKAPASKLSSAAIFQEYFRGLYFQVEKSGSSPTNLALMDFAKSGNAKITIKYKAKTAVTTDPDATTEDKSIIINLTGAQAGLYQDNRNPDFDAAIKSPNQTTGDDRLYLKGRQGSLAVIQLTGFAAKLDEIRTKNWLVNEANLIFSIDSDKMTGAYEPKRVYLYDLDNSLPILDYTSDGSSSITTDAKMTKVVYSGIINVDATTKRGTTYKIRLTNHIRNIIKNATVANVRLGLVVTGDINTITSSKLKLKNTVISDAPRASVMSPLGTILFGGNSSSNIPAGKKLQLEIYYTKPN
ncbi:uncharacterized protein DUF4270 [Flavobacterium araucananum]|uniref:DUF4270 domain-containing protein n=1 Tax=Flavobacterium araucananum TaxID=946678 RepID=A0A227NEX2_9FLAO|nr:DUF4270 domain-containing protein [Flavobacterium araucananum]OXE95398.1 hypothetical protein B0A64_24450 [Flavobacterium araucananum]PWK02275.1 uncharacterized protein DUF4270 [Flavobacterium araucananum]